MTDNSLMIREKIKNYVLQAVYADKEKIKDEYFNLQRGIL